MHGPHLAGGRCVKPASHLRDRLGSHVDVMPVRLIAGARAGSRRRRAFVPHLLHTHADDLSNGGIPWAFILRAARRADGIGVTGMGDVFRSVIFGHLIGARFPVSSASQCGQARALSEKLIDAVNAVLVDVARGGWSRKLASEVLHTTTRAPTSARRRAPSGIGCGSGAGCAAARLDSPLTATTRPTQNRTTRSPRAA